MLSPEAVGALAALFIVGMVWLRTRMHYAREARVGRSLTAAGVRYFALLAVMLLAGWFAAPYLAHAVAPNVALAATLARVVAFLLVYYLFIPLHRALQARGVAVFK